MTHRDRELDLATDSVLFDATANWYPVAASHEIVQGAIVQGFLDGQELALWRSSNGGLHAWENRCPHRGTRFTLGRVVDDGVECAYHGWHFDAEGQCTRIPANPKLTPPRSACAQRFAVREAYGLAWVTLGHSPWTPLELDEAPQAYCRSFVMACSARQARSSLLACQHLGYREVHPAILARAPQPEQPEFGSVVFLQPMKPDRTIAHLCLSGDLARHAPADKRLFAATIFKSHRVHAEGTPG